jgi:hypothetical protein
MTKLQLRLTPKLALVYVLFAAVLLLFVGVMAYYSGRSSLEAATASEMLSTPSRTWPRLAFHRMCLRR